MGQLAQEVQESLTRDSETAQPQVVSGRKCLQLQTRGVHPCTRGVWREVAANQGRQEETNPGGTERKGRT